METRERCAAVRFVYSGWYARCAIRNSDPRDFIRDLVRFSCRGASPFFSWARLWAMNPLPTEPSGYWTLGRGVGKSVIVNEVKNLCCVSRP